MFWGSKRSLMARMTRSSGPGGPQTSAAVSAVPSGCLQHDHLAAGGDGRNAHEALREQSASLRVPRPSPLVPADANHAVAGVGLNRAVRINLQQLADHFDHRAGQHVDLNVGREIGQPAPQRLRAAGGNQHRRGGAGRGPLAPELLDHPIHFRRGPLEADVQPADVAFQHRPQHESSSRCRPATNSMATGRVGDRTSPASSFSATSKSGTSQTNNTDASGSGRTISVTCVMTPSVPSEPAIRRHML